MIRIGLHTKSLGVHGNLFELDILLSKDRTDKNKTSENEFENELSSDHENCLPLLIASSFGFLQLDLSTNLSVP